MECYDDKKYQLLGYIPQLQRYVFTDRLFQDNEICVRQAIIRTDKGKIRLSEGNKDNNVPELDLKIFNERQVSR